MKNIYYAIIERSNRFCVLKTGYGSEKQAWDNANNLNTKYPEIVKDYDVLYFDTEKDMLEYFIDSAKM